MQAQRNDGDDPAGNRRCSSRKPDVEKLLRCACRENTDCDPETQVCFIGCDDDDCIDEYYYSYITRPAPVVRSLCGEDITDCDAAYECQVDEIGCEISFCDPEADDNCEDIGL